MMNQVTAWLELGAYALLILLGTWLVYKHAAKPLLSFLLVRLHEYRHRHQHHNHRHDHHHDHHDDCGCGHTHVPDLKFATGKLSLRKAWGAILAIGLRPCSGAILVLVFALSQQFFMAGVAAALAMGLGTGLTVAALALTSLTLGRMAEAAGGGQQHAWGQRIGQALQALAALAVLLFGVLLFSAAWQYGAF